MTGQMQIVVDSREQAAYEFDTQKVESIRRALPAGDYSLVGWEDRVAVERKSLEDFVSTVIRSRKRFREELRKLSGYESACVVVEANLRDVLTGHYRSGAHPNAILGSVVSICLDYGVPVYFCSDRQVACRFVEEYLRGFLRKSESCQR